ncbi:MAG: hypothetical protein D6728_05440 [Cyanobacteria bacterium J055]|nr:MAG: hypothetical protein D6728_05440 [Cyanobacteria bacterium J055]
MAILRLFNRQVFQQFIAENRFLIFFLFLFLNPSQFETLGFYFLIELRGDRPIFWYTVIQILIEIT